MKITADNRGRIALGKLDRMVHLKMGISHLSGSEWDVEYKNCQLIVKPWKEEPKSEWVEATTLAWENIGQVIWVKTRKKGLHPVVETLGGVSEPKGVCGVLESFHKEDGFDVTKVTLRGGEVFEFEQYGEFWVKA